MNFNRFTKKTLAIFLSMALLISVLFIPGAVSAADNDIEIWDGSVATSFAGGTGTAADPYMIENGAQLAFAIQYNVTDNAKYNKHFALANDIYLNDITKIDWKTGEVEEGYTPTTWIHQGIKDGNSGYFHGNGHSVYGLYINEPANGTGTRVGLVPLTWNGVKFYDFGMDYTYINTQGPASFFIGYGKSSASTYSEFENCWVGENSTLISAGSASGFAYGQFKYITFKNCYSVANLTGGGKVAAFAGDVWGSPTMWFKNCYSIGAFYKNHGGEITNGYSTEQEAEGLTKVDAANMVGAKVQTYMPMLGEAFAVTDGYPVFKAQTDNDAKYWGGFLTEATDADSDGAYEINTPEEMAWYVKNGGSAKLMSDLYLNDLTVTVEGGTPTLKKASDGSAVDPADNDLLEWFGAGTALGSTASHVYKFDGDGHVIYGLFHNHGDLAVGANYAGIFNQIAGGTSIYGVGIEDAYMVSNASWAAALLVGRENSVTYTIDSCYAGENTYHKGYDTAALVGGGGKPAAPATIKNCYVYTTLVGTHGTSYTNAFTGDNWDATSAHYYNCFTTDDTAYRAGTAKIGLYCGVKLDAIKGRGGQVTMPDLGDAFVITAEGPQLKIFADNVKESVWNGFVANEFAGGSGTEDDPYMIETGSQLALAVRKSAANTYYKLANDIYLNDLSKINWADGSVTEGYQPRSWYDDVSVQGNFDGDGHMVYGLYRSNGSSGSWGIGGTALFPVMADKATLNITGFGVDKAYVCGWHGGGAFVGNGPNNDTIDSYLNISESFVGADVVIKGYDAGAAVGDNRGIHTTVTDFYSLATLQAKSCYGIATDLWGGSITLNRVYNGNGPLDSKGNANATHSYATKAGGNGAVVVSQDVMKGEQTAVTMFGLGDKFMSTDSYPVLTLFAESVNEDNLLGKAPFEGSGIEADPYLISTKEDLKNMVGLGGLGAYYEFMNDIYLNDVNSVDWLSGTVNEGYSPETWFVGHNENGNGYESFLDANAAFSGTVNGNGYAVHGIYYALGNNSTVAGLLPYVNTANLINLGIEDSFIGSGRFTGGFVGFGKTVNLTGCYVDDSCAVFGWDAGADYVNADGDINTTGGGDKLCRGSATYTYKEDANGTYVKSGDSYHAFTAADYEGTKYTYDEENSVYTESADGTYLLDGETYREITINDYNGTRYAVDDVIFSGVVFTSNALGGLVGRYMTKGVIENCYVTAEVRSNPIYAFGKAGQGVTFKNPGTNGGGMGHTGGLWGDDWASGTTKVVTATDCFSIINGHENVTNCTFTDVYTLASNAVAGITKVSNAQGVTALDEMPGLDTDVWYAIMDSVDYPQFTLRGTVIGDVNENGIGAEKYDVEILRETIIGSNDYRLTDYNRDGETDICDLVKLSLAANEKAAAEEEAAKNLLPEVYVSSEGSDESAGTSDAPVKTLKKAYSLVQHDGYIYAAGTVTVTELPAGEKRVFLDDGTFDLSGMDVVNFGTDVLFSNCTLKFKDGSTVYANGNDLVISNNVVVEGIPAAIYGGGNSAVAETYLDLRAGSYKAIYGGGDKGAVLGNTNLYLMNDVNKDLDLTAAGASYIYGGGNTGTVYGSAYVDVSGNVNAPLDHESHTAIARLYGGSKNGNVKFDTHITVSENAEFSYIYGGCQSGTVGGATNINFSGKAMSIYGGSGTVTETNVYVNDGAWVHQVFGGCEGASMTGNTNVTVYGGYIDRRIVGGCYNNATREGFSMVYTSENYVTGNTTVTLYDEATYNLSGDDYGVTALSRHSTNHDAENGTLIFETSELQTKLKSKLGIRWVLGTLAPAADTQTVQ